VFFFSASLCVKRPEEAEIIKIDELVFLFINFKAFKEI
jgi:hypothetical protein